MRSVLPAATYRGLNSLARISKGEILDAIAKLANSLPKETLIPEGTATPEGTLIEGTLGKMAKKAEQLVHTKQQTLEGHWEATIHYGGTDSELTRTPIEVHVANGTIALSTTVNSKVHVWGEVLKKNIETTLYPVIAVDATTALDLSDSWLI